MARGFRVWEKKRGHRRTGSRLAGSLGEAIFSGTLFLLGVLSLAALLLSQTLRSPSFTPGFGFWVMVMVLASFILLGGGGLVWTLFHVSASAERRSALARQASRFDPGRAAENRRGFPGIPSDANLTNSPGVRLKYRLPLVQSTAWRIVFASIFCLIWNASASVLVAMAIHSHLSGQSEWFLTLFTVPFVGIGGYSIYDLIRQLVLVTGIGPTNVEVSDHPFRPARRYQVHLSQAGKLAMRSLTLRLVCEEHVTYRQGTDLRTESWTVFDQQFFRRTDFRIDPGMPFEHACDLSLPPSAMHSFQSEHNAINWKLVVRGEADSWPPFEREFPLLVWPIHDGNPIVDRTPDLAAHS